MGLLRSHNTLIWLLLVFATVLSFVLAEDLEFSPLATSGIVAVAAFKVRLVFLHFMELKTAPGPWRWIFEGWTLLVLVLVLGGYWLSQL